MNFIITIRYEIPMFLLVGPFFEEGGGGLENFGQKLKFYGFFQLRSPLDGNILSHFWAKCSIFIAQPDKIIKKIC